MPVLLGGLELPETLLLFLFSLHNPREGLEPLQPEIFRLAFFIFYFFLLAVCQDERAVMLTSSRGLIPATCPPPSQSPQGHRSVWKCPARVDGGSRKGGDATRYPPSPLALLGSPWHSNFLAGVVRSSLPSMSGGPAQRAMPGSL